MKSTKYLPFKQGLALSGSFFILFFLISALLEMALVPWDGVPFELRPPLTDPARQWNDFFEIGIGAILLLIPSLLLILSGILRFALSKKKKEDIATEMLVAHSLFIFGLIVSTLLVPLFDQRAPSFGYSPIRIAIFCLLLVVLFVFQAGYLPKFRFRSSS